MISSKEIEILKVYTQTPKALLEKMFNAIDAAKKKQSHVKWVKVSYSLKELDKIILNIANKANDKNSSESVQNGLDNMFGKFSEKYNNCIGKNKEV